MSDPIKDGGPAFPTDSEQQNGPHSWHYEGLSMRDYFAGQALAGCLANDNVRGSFGDIASDAYKQADAMIAQREVTQ